MKDECIDPFRGLGITVEIDKRDFLTICETLTRIGVESKRSKTLFQSCHILHKRGKYAIMHFKEMFLLDGKVANISVNDYARRNQIVHLLQEWGLVRVTEPDFKYIERAPMNQIKIIPHSKKSEWNLVPKYTIGNRESRTRKSV